MPAAEEHAPPDRHGPDLGQVAGVRLALRAVAAFAALPGLVGFVIPLAFIGRGRAPAVFDPRALPLILAGSAALIWCVRDFSSRGRGTLAPWDPPRRLVVTGLYRYSRNPMYIAVALVLLGWACAFHSVDHLAYALIVIVLFHLRIVYGEEPWLARTHGREWTRYAGQVRRWL
jgi:protein-S-isoprenylcysteine O-methyltransferase Ste14